MSGERPVVIEGPAGTPLFGILHEPAVPIAPRVGVNLLNPGLKSRVAPNRLNVVLARHLCDLGYFVLRFDPPGIGDSGDELPEHVLPELWQQVQRGAFVEATRLANDAFASECSLDEIVGIGNCGGAITALLEARDDRRVRRLVLIDLPVTLRDTDLGKQKQIRGARHGGKVLRGYLRRMKDPRAWMRLLTLRSNVRVIGQAVRARFVDPVRDAGRKPDREAPPPAGLAPGEVLSRPFVEAMTAFHERGGRALFVNAGDYDNTFVFDRLFAEPYLAPGSAWADRHPRHVVPGANHVYGTPEWRRTLLERIDAWLGPKPARESVPRGGGAAEPVAVSVVIPTMNRPDDLARCLTSIARQHRRPLEVIVVDDGEVDVGGLGALVEGAGIEFVYRKKAPRAKGVCASRNIAIDLARGDAVVFLDDDTELDPGYVGAFAEILEADPERRIGGLSGARLTYRGRVPRRPSRLSWEERFRRVFLLASARGAHVLPSGFRSSLREPADSEPVDFLQGGNMIVRREVLEKFRFDETLDRFGGYAMGEDVSFSYPIGKEYRLLATSRARLAHFHSEGGRPGAFVMNKMYVVHQWRFLREVMKGGPLNIAAYGYAVTGLFLIRAVQLVRWRRREHWDALRGVLAGVRLVLTGRSRAPATGRSGAALAAD